MFIHYDVVCGPIGKNPPPGEDFMTTLDLDYHLIISDKSLRVSTVIDEEIY